MDEFNIQLNKENKIDINHILEELIDKKYSAFSSSLIPGADNILGVRIPLLRKLAKEISKKDWKLVVEHGTEDSFEAIMLKGMILGCVPLSYDEIKDYIWWYLPKITNWSLCDGFCVSLKITKKYKDEMFQLIQQCLESKEDYTVRFGLVMLITYYVEEKYLEYIFETIEQLDCKNYYVMMAVAWLVATCYTKATESTYIYLTKSKLDIVTFNKSIQKIVESQKVSIMNKNLAKDLKRKMI